MKAKQTLYVVLRHEDYYDFLDLVFYDNLHE